MTCTVSSGALNSTPSIHVVKPTAGVLDCEQFVLPEPICGARVAAAGDVLVVVWTDSGRVISLNVERRIFRRLADLRRPHVGGATTVIGGRVYITGGGGAGSDAYVFVLLHSLLILLTMPHTRGGRPPTNTHTPFVWDYPGEPVPER